MISIKSPKEIELMREAGRITALALQTAGAAVRPGITTQELNDIYHGVITKNGATPNVMGQYGFAKSCCISVNEELIHGTPSKRKLRGGDIVSIDGGACFEGYNGDASATFPVGEISEEAKKLISTTKLCFREAVSVIREGVHLRDVCQAIERRALACGFEVCRRFTGHGIGRDLHEDPEVPCFPTVGRGPRLRAGMTLAIEPMVCVGDGEVEYGDDAFVVVTENRRLCAHHEHTVLVTKTGYELLTELSGVTT